MGLTSKASVACWDAYSATALASSLVTSPAKMRMPWLYMEVNCLTAVYAED